MREDIRTEEDIKQLVHTFYDKVRADERLSVIFNEVIKDNWDSHLQTMCDFWSTLLLYSGRYRNDPMSKHKVLPVDSAHFGKWIELFQETIDELFSGETADAAKKRAANIARVMQTVIGVTR